MYASQRSEVMLSSINFEDVQFRFRRNLREDIIKKYAESIKTGGLINPIKLRWKDGKLQIIAGWQRVEAARRLNLPTIMADVYTDLSDEEAMRLNITDNNMRENLNEVEIAYQIEALKQKFSTEKIVEMFGFSSHDRVYDLLKLVKMDHTIQNAVEEGKISLRHAVLIERFPVSARAETLEKTIREELSVNKLQKDLSYTKHPYYKRYSQEDIDTEKGKWHAFRFPQYPAVNSIWRKRWELTTKLWGVPGPFNCEFSASIPAHEHDPPYVCNNDIEQVVLSSGEFPCQRDKIRAEIWRRDTPLEDRDGWFFWCTDCVKMVIPSCIFHPDKTYEPCFITDMRKQGLI